MSDFFACLDQSPGDRARLIAANLILKSVHESDYSAACQVELTILKKQLQADYGVLVYRDEKNTIVTIDTDTLAVRTVKYAELDTIKTALNDTDKPFGWKGKFWKYPLCVSIMQGNGLVMYMVLCRESSPFTPDEKLIFQKTMLIVTDFETSRYDKMQEEIARQRAQSALQRTEKRLRTFFEQASDFKYMANADDIVASINPAGLKLLKISDRFEVVGRPFSLWNLSPDDRQLIWKKIEEHGFVQDHEVIIVCADKTKCICLESAQAVRDQAGNLVEIHGSLRNVSETIKMERQMWALNLEIVEANNQLKSTQMQMIQREKLASIGQLAAGIAHEINNPLGFLMSNHTMISKFIRTFEKACHRVKDLESDMYASIEKDLDLAYVFSEMDDLLLESSEGYSRIIEIVKNLKNFARIDDSEKFATYDLEKGIESTLIVARNELKYAAEVTLEFCGLPCIQAHGGLINQVLLNIVVNSAQAIRLKHGEAMGKIKICTKKVENLAICIIEDDGIGISEDKLLTIFDPFYTTKKPGEGTGMGLSLSYDIIVNKHHGTLVAEHSAMGGALFRIELPIGQFTAEDTVTG